MSHCHWLGQEGEREPPTCLSSTCGLPGDVPTGSWSPDTGEWLGLTVLPSTQTQPCRDVPGQLLAGGEDGFWPFCTQSR